MQSHSFPQRQAGPRAASYEATGVIGRQAQRFVFRRGAVLDHLDLSPRTFALLPVTSSFQLPPPGGAKNTRTELGFGSVVGWVCAKFLDSAASAHGRSLGSGKSRLVLGALGVFFCSLCAHRYVKSETPPLSTPPFLPVLEAQVTSSREPS